MQMVLSIAVRHGGEEFSNHWGEGARHVVSVDQQVGHGGLGECAAWKDVGKGAREVRGVTCVIAGDDERRGVYAPEVLDCREGAVVTDCRRGSGAVGVSALNGLGDEVGYERRKVRNEQLPGGL